MQAPREAQPSWQEIIAHGETPTGVCAEVISKSRKIAARQSPRHNPGRREGYWPRLACFSKSAGRHATGDWNERAAILPPSSSQMLPGKIGAAKNIGTSKSLLAFEQAKVQLIAFLQE